MYLRIANLLLFMRNQAFVVLLSLSLLSCSLNPQWKKVQGVKTFLKENPDSALSVLNSVSKNGFIGGACKAEVSLLKAMAIDELYIDTTDVSLINPAVDFYRKKGTPEERVLSLFYLGRMQLRVQDFDKAIITFSEAVPYLQDVEDIEIAVRFYSAVSEVYRETFDYAEAIRFAKLGYEKVCMLQQDTLMKCLAMYDLAKAYAATDSVSVSDSLYSELLNCGEVVSAKFLSDVSCDYAVSKINRPAPDPKTALVLFDKVLSHSGTLKEAYQCGAYAYALALVGDYRSSDAILTTLKEMSVGEYHYWSSLVESSSGNYKKAYDNQKIALVHKDSLVSKTLGQSISKAQRDFYANLQKKEQEKAEILKLWLFIIVLGAVVLLTISFVLYKKKLDEAEKEKAFLFSSAEAVKAQLSESQDLCNKQSREIENSKRESEIVRRQLRMAYTEMYKKQFEDFETISEAVLTAEPGKTKSRSINYKNIYEKAKDILKVVSSDEEGRMRFESIINERMDGIMSRFRSDFPELKDEDYHLICYFFAGFKTSVIELIFKHLSAPAIYTRKYRLKKMIELSSVENKQQYLDLLGQFVNNQ